MSDVVVIGAGVMGASIALDLSRAGRNVTVVDKGEAVGAGSTSASSSVVRTSYSTLDGVTAAWESTHAWQAFESHVGEITGPVARFVRCGMLMLAAPGFDRERTVGHLETVGVPHEIISADDLPVRFPAIDNGRYGPPAAAQDPGFFRSADGLLDALWLPDSGFVDDPQLAAANMMQAALAAGATLRLRAEVSSVDLSTQHTSGASQATGVTLVDGERLNAPVVVNAAGPWSAQINARVTADLGMTVTTRALRQEVHTLGAAPGFLVESGGAVVGDLDLGAYFRPHFGDTMIVGGVEADCDPLVWLDDADACNAHVTLELFENQGYRAARRVPGAKIPHQPKGVGAAYDVSGDWVPIYDRTSVDGYYLAVGTSGNQFKNAPIVGGIMTRLIEACDRGHDHDADPVIYHCGRIDRPLNLGHYSRCRELNATSGTVIG
ncbi:MAG: FAD-dependent oxidoreductase [Acidimicrobiaceae bacterium]|nr:FAD-dependent oxidoreductase [Acidimicrobiaceae bacterium]